MLWLLLMHLLARLLLCPRLLLKPHLWWPSLHPHLLFQRLLHPWLKLPLRLQLHRSSLTCP